MTPHTRAHAVRADGGPATALVAALAGRGWTLAVAESLTGGALTASVVDVPGASRVLRGGVVAYATELKALLLGVDPALLARAGAVDPDVAGQMASGARARLDADVGIATTGVAGPAGQDGHAPGEVFVAVASVQGVQVRRLRLPGDRAAVRRGACEGAVQLALEVLAGERGDAGEGAAALGNTDAAGHVG